MLSPAEEALYQAQSSVDRCHSVDCALAARSALGARATAANVVASALHDVGKVDADFGTLGRVGATLVGKVAPPAVIDRWDSGPDVLARRIAWYTKHDERGAAKLMAAGSHPTVVAWAREHHEPPREWSIDPVIGHALRAADR